MKFKPEDFSGPLTGNQLNWDIAWQQLAEIANAKLAEWLESAPVVYGKPTTGIWRIENNPIITHTAKLVCIEEMPKEPCKHEPVVRLEMSEAILASLGKKGLGTIFCKHCQAELVVAEWKTKE